MTLFRRSAGTLAGAALLLGVAASGAVAEDTEVSFTVDADGSGLSVGQSSNTASVQEGGSNPVFDAAGVGSLSGSLPTLTVTDQRGTLLGAWTVQVTGEDWVHSTDGTQTVAASNGHVYLDAATLGALTTALGGALDGMVLTGAELNVGVNDLASAYTFLSGTTTVGDGTVDVTPTIDITVPAGTPVGTYSATVTQTVS